MNHARTLAFTAGIFLLLGGAPFSTLCAKESGGWKKDLRSSDPATRRGAYRAIDALNGKEQEAALKELLSQQKSAARRARGALRAISRPTRKVRENLDKKEAARKAWEKAAEEAYAAIQDRVKFPTPNGPVSGPYKGFDFVDNKTRECKKVYDPFREVVDEDLAGWRRMSTKTAGSSLDALDSAMALATELAVECKKHGLSPQGLPGKNDRLAFGLAYLRAGRWESARRVFDGSNPASPSPAARGPRGRNPFGPGGPGRGARGREAPAAPNPNAGKYRAEDNPFHKMFEKLREGNGAGKSDPLPRGASGRSGPAPRPAELEASPRSTDIKAAPRPSPRGVEPGPALEGYERAVMWHYYAWLVEEYNPTVKTVMNERDYKAVAHNNRYRVMLMVHPLQVEAKVTAAMHGHLTEMNQLGYFAHESPNPRNRKISDRLRNHGYRAMAMGENIAQGSLMSAMDKWKWDGGHHRNLVSRSHTQIGASEVGSNSGMDTVHGEPLAIPTFSYRK